MPFAKVNDLNIYYEVHGEGDIIILLHHGFGCSKIWKTIHPILTEGGYQVVMFDRRGFGRSERGDDFPEFYESDRYRSESMAELKTIKDYLGIGDCHLVGQCEGGVIGVDYSIKYPGEVRSLLVSSTQCFSEVTMAELNAAKFVPRYADLTPELQAKMIEWHGEAAQINYDQFTKGGGAYGLGHFDLRPILPSVSCPALVLYPDRSSIFSVEQSVAFYRHLPRGELAVFPKCGHNTYEQRPIDYARTILDFIARTQQGETTKVPGPAMTCLA